MRAKCHEILPTGLKYILEQFRDAFVDIFFSYHSSGSSDGKL